MLAHLKETKTNIKLILIAAALLMLAVGVFVFAWKYQINMANAATANRSELNSKIQQLQTKINSYQQSIIETQKLSATLQNEITIYDSQIASLELQIEATKTQTEDMTLQVNELQTQIDRRKAEIEDNKVVLGELVRQIALLDNDSFIQIGLGTDNFSAFLDQVQYNRSISQQVYNLVAKIKDIKQKLETQQNDLKKSLDKLNELSQQLQISQETLNEQKTSKQQLLAQTKGNEKNYQKLLAATTSQQGKVEKELYDLDVAAGRRVGAPNISAKKGVLAWPMEGVVTQGYGNTGFTDLGYSFHNGIDIAAPAGQPIYAAADGIVDTCNSSNYAYGNWCSILHTVDSNSGPAQIVTLYGHMRSYVVSAGQVVKQGDLIGFEGNTGNTTRLLYGAASGFHVHFTIFARTGYTVTKGSYGDYLIPSGVTLNPFSFLGS